MSATTFAQLSQEIQDMIWAEAAAIQVQLTDNHTSSSPLAERQRQSLVGYDNLPTYKKRDPLRVYVYASRNEGKLRIGVNEFQVLVNSLPMATVCSEARSHALKACRVKVQVMSIFYGIDKNEDNFSEPLQEPILAQPTTVMVTNAIQTWRPQGEDDRPPGFDSAEQVVDIVSRVFSKCVTRIDLNPRYHTQWESLEKIYWPHTEQTRSLRRRRPTVLYGAEENYSFETNPPPTIAYMTPERVLHIQDIWNRESSYDVDLICWHLCKFHELLDVSKERLPRLRSIALTHFPDGDCLTSIRATEKDGALWINREDFGVSFHFGFEEYRGN
ncbi:hypothetical protein N0V90_008769 [Kalmusia sp. IMI 367209]|nr:hypothetical protein N0V90_008769 [Kalmusia sp. IMI 367209]